MRSFRREIEAITDTPVSPAAPTEFLQLIVGSVVTRAEQLRPAVSRANDPELTTLLEDFVEAVTNEGVIVTEALEGAEFGTFDALSAVLGHYNGAHLYAARTLRTHYEDDLSAETIETLEMLIELLGHLGRSSRLSATRPNS